jgi:hypothetical protein
VLRRLGQHTLIRLVVADGEPFGTDMTCVRSYGGDHRLKARQYDPGFRICRRPLAAFGSNDVAAGMLTRDRGPAKARLDVRRAIQSAGGEASCVRRWSAG